MKITSNLPTPGLDAVRRSAPAAPREVAAAPAGARLSSVGSIVSELRTQAAAYGVEGDVRPDVVAQIKGELAAARASGGSFGTAMDIERTIDALLQEM